MSDLTVSKSFLMALLNEGVRQGKKSITIYSPLLDVDLVGADLEKPEIEWFAERGRYDRAFSEVETKLGDPLLIKDVPTYNDFKEVVEDSLLVTPENMTELTDNIRQIEKQRRGSARYPKQTLLAIDTNIAYRRLLSRLLMTSEGCGLPDFDPSDVAVVIENLVQMEISERVNRKYREQDLDAFRKAYKNPKLLMTMSNGAVKESRKALNAQAELTTLRSRYAVWEVAGAAWDADKEKRDNEMIRSLAKHSMQERVDVLFLTADDKATAAAMANRLPSISLRYSRELPSIVPFDPWLFVELLHDLAVVYSVVGIRGLGVRVHGDWGGKTADDYRTERVRLAFEESSTIGHELARQWRVVERVQAEIGTRSVT